MKLPSLLTGFENKWVAMTGRPKQVVAWAASFKALENKLKKNQRSKVTVMKVPKFDQHFH